MKLENFLTILLRYDRWLLWIAIPLVSILMHARIWTLELTGAHVWRQTQTQQTIDSFVEEDFCILNPRVLERGAGDGISRLEFPLYQWLVAVVAKLVSGSVLTSRIVTFFISCWVVWGMHALAMAWSKDRLTALLTAFLGAFAPVIYYYAICPLPDMLPLACGIWSLAILLKCVDRFSWRQWGLSLALAGLATLLKLPYIMFFAGHLAMIGLLLQKKRGVGLGEMTKATILSRGTLLSGAALLPAIAWYAWVMPTWGSSGAVQGLFTDEVNWGELSDIALYQATQMYPRTLMSIATLPLFVWGIYQCFKRRSELAQGGKGLILGAMATAFLLFNLYELRLIGSAHDYYMLPIVPLLAIVTAFGASQLVKLYRWWSWLLVLALLCLVPLMTYRRIHPRWQPQNAEFNRDFFLHQAALRSAVPDDALVAAGPDVSHTIFLYYIHKKGWSWDENQTFNAAKLQGWRDQGAAYFYCSDRAYDTLSSIQPLIGLPVATLGSVQIYKLR